MTSTRRFSAPQPTEDLLAEQLQSLGLYWMNARSNRCLICTF